MESAVARESVEVALFSCLVTQAFNKNSRTTMHLFFKGFAFGHAKVEDSTGNHGAQ